jgi:hypothetical protein
MEPKCGVASCKRSDETRKAFRLGRDAKGVTAYVRSCGIPGSPSAHSSAMARSCLSAHHGNIRGCERSRGASIRGANMGQLVTYRLAGERIFPEPKLTKLSAWPNAITSSALRLIKLHEKTGRCKVRLLLGARTGIAADSRFQVMLRYRSSNKCAPSHTSLTSVSPINVLLCDCFLILSNAIAQTCRIFCRIHWPSSDKQRCSNGPGQK